MAPQTIEIAKNGLESVGLRWFVRRIGQANSAGARRVDRGCATKRRFTTQDRNAAGSAETQRLERGHQRAGSEYNLEGELRRGKLILI